MQGFLPVGHNILTSKCFLTILLLSFQVSGYFFYPFRGIKKCQTQSSVSVVLVGLRQIVCNTCALYLQVIKQLSECCQCKQIVDIGAGLGHLSRHLTFGQELKVTTVEATSCHAPKASTFDRYSLVWKCKCKVMLHLILESECIGVLAQVHQAE